MSFPLRYGQALLAAGALALAAACSGPTATELVAAGVEEAYQGRNDAALALFERALDAEPDHPGALYNAGLAALLDGQFEEARARLAHLIAQEPEDGRSLYYLARAHAGLEQNDEALEALRKAVAAGFADVEALADDGFAALRRDIRFMQLLGVASQRAGRRMPADDRGRLVIGDAVVDRIEAPGFALGCEAPAEAPEYEEPL